MSKFQAILLAIFIICILAGVAMFATYKNNTARDTLPTVTIWGTFPEATFSNLIREVNYSAASTFSVNYVEKSLGSFDKDFIEALARGQGPDAILISQDMILRHADKVTPIPYTVITERDFRNTYIPQAELYLTSQGSLAIPFTVNPLVMYWNRDMFTSAGIATYPRFWEEFTGIISKIDQKDVNSNIRRSAISMGEFANIDHARELLGALLLQAGNTVTGRGASGLESTLGDASGVQGTRSSSSAINFFTKFADPRSTQYSWNRSLPSSKSWFLSGNLATYFGFASEILDLRAKNPNIDFDVAPLPQAKNGKSRVTYGSMFGFSLVKNSRLQSAAYNVFQRLTTPAALASLSTASYLPPVRRDMIATGSSDPYLSIFYDSALISKGWLDMDSSQTKNIFQNMVESITSGRADIYSAIQTADSQLNISLKSQ